MKALPRLLSTLTALLISNELIHAQTNTAFTYQGQLIQNGVPASGTFDFQFGLYTNSTSGSSTAIVTNLAVPVINGVFTSSINFSNAFNGTSFFLDIGVRPNGGSGAFTELTNRQSISPTPYALYAPSAGTVTGSVAISNLPPNVAYLNSNAVFTGSVTAANFVGNGSGLTGITSTTTNGNYLYAYDTTQQILTATPPTFQLIGFNNSPQINGWTVSPIGPEHQYFVAGASGLYQVQYQAELNGTVGRTVSFAATDNNTEIPGSQAAVTMGTNVTIINKTFFANINANDLIRLQFTVDVSSTVNLLPSGTGTTKPSVSLSIVKIN